MTEIKLTKRYPQSRTEDIVDVYMRGWNDALDAVQNGKFIINDDRKTENCSENPNNCEDDEYLKHLFIEVVKGHMSDASANQAWYEYINHKDEPQTDCGDFADRLAYERGVKHAWEVAQKVFDSTITFYEAEDVAKQIDKGINVRSKDEPQTECQWK